MDDKIIFGKGENLVCLLPEMANRHGLIAGATGTGKTVSLKVLTESFSDMGVPVRTTVSDMGPLLLSRLMELNETRSSILNITFKIADDMGMLILDLKDLKAVLRFIGDNSKELRTEYGNMSPQSIGAIQRRLQSQ